MILNARSQSVQIATKSMLRHSKVVQIIQINLMLKLKTKILCKGTVNNKNRTKLNQEKPRNKETKVPKDNSDINSELTSIVTLVKQTEKRLRINDFKDLSSLLQNILKNIQSQSHYHDKLFSFINGISYFIKKTNVNTVQDNEVD